MMGLPLVRPAVGAHKCIVMVKGKKIIGAFAFTAQHTRPSLTEVG